MATVNISDLFRRAFGYETPESFSIEQAPNRKMVSSLGGSYYAESISGVEFFLPIKLNNYLLPFAVMSVTCKKTIVSTPMPERQGSIHEQISVDDYVFNIKGIAVSETNDYPEDDIMQLNKLFLLNEPLTINSVLTQIILKGDPKVILTSLSFPANAGVENAKPFEMELESDMIFELKEKV